jgi:hypothetical protein
MKTPVRSSHGRLEYTGRIARDAFAVWAESPEGLTAIDRVAAHVGFAFFGKTYSAQQQIWRQLTKTARAESVAAAVQREVDAALNRLDTFVFADALPSCMVDLRRLIVVPRLFVNGEAYRRIQHAFDVQPAVRGLKGGEALRRWFVTTVIDSLATAVASMHPSLRHPVPVGEGWTIVGIDRDFEWHTPFKGPAWPGHYFMLEITPRPITRAVRSEVGEAIAQLQTALPQLSQADRDEILRRASLSLDQLFGSNRSAAKAARYLVHHS